MGASTTSNIEKSTMDVSPWHQQPAFKVWTKCHGGRLLMPILRTPSSSSVLDDPYYGTMTGCNNLTSRLHAAESPPLLNSPPSHQAARHAMKPTTAVQTDSYISVPYTLVEVDAVSADIPKLSVVWRNVQVSVTADQEKPILSGVSGEAFPGELLVIMTPCGTSKSTLLGCIANARSFTGSVHVNGSPWTAELAKRACYVAKEDLFYASLTVKQHLLLQAELRLGSSIPPSERAACVAEVVGEVGLTTVVDSLIGNANAQGLSGEQRKRLSIATELLTNPSIMFVEEPTTGLDNFSAEMIIRQLQALARQGRTVIATVYEPPSPAFALFDKLHLLSDGRTVFRGRASECVNHLASHGLHCPLFTNPADYFMQQLLLLEGDAAASSRAKSMCAAWADVESAAVPSLEVDISILEFTGKIQRNAQLGLLCKRNLMRLARDPAIRARIFAPIVVALVCGILFPQLKVNQAGVQSFTAAIFFFSVTQFAFSANLELQSFPQEILLVLREHDGGWYHALSWYLIKNIIELPIQLVAPMLFLVPGYFIVGFGGDTEMFFTFYLFIVLATSVGTGMGYMVSCAIKRGNLAPMVGILLIVPFALFGGLIINSKATPVYFVWLQQLSPVKYCFHGLMRAFWTNVPTIPCPTGACRFTSGATVLANNHIRTDRLVIDCIILLAINVGFRLVGGLFLCLRAAKSKR